MSDLIPDLIEPVIGWRCWRIDEATGLLYALNAGMLGSSDDGARIWPPRAVEPAVCNAYDVVPKMRTEGDEVVMYSEVVESDRHPELPSPQMDCRCGWYAAKSLHDVQWPADSVFAFGRVALWGRVIEHGSGYRAQYAYPLDLRIVVPEQPTVRRGYSRNAGYLVGASQAMVAFNAAATNLQASLAAAAASMQRVDEARTRRVRHDLLASLRAIRASKIRQLPPSAPGPSMLHTRGRKQEPASGYARLLMAMMAPASAPPAVQYAQHVVNVAAVKGGHSVILASGYGLRVTMATAPILVEPGPRKWHVPPFRTAEPRRAMSYPDALRLAERIAATYGVPGVRVAIEWCRELACQAAESDGYVGPDGMVAHDWPRKPGHCEPWRRG